MSYMYEDDFQTLTDEIKSTHSLISQTKLLNDKISKEQFYFTPTYRECKYKRQSTMDI